MFRPDEVRRSLPAAVALLVALTLAWPPLANGSTVLHHVLTAGQESAVRQMLAPGPGELIPECALGAVAIRTDHIVASYEGARCRFAVQLAHVSTASPDTPRTQRFSLSFQVPEPGGVLPGEAREALVARVREREGSVRWRALHATADVGRWGEASTRALVEATRARQQGQEAEGCAALLALSHDAQAPLATRHKAATAALTCAGPHRATAEASLRAMLAQVEGEAEARSAGVDPLRFPALVAASLGDDSRVGSAAARLGEERRQGEICEFMAEAGGVSASAGQREQAERLLARYLAEHPDCGAAHQVRLRNLAEAGDDDGLDSAMRAALRERPKDAELLVLAGLIRLERAENDQARALLERAFALEPRYPGLLGKIGSLYAFAGCRDEDMAEMERRRAKNPEDWLARYVRASCAHYRREYAQCVKEMEPVRERYPEEPRVYVYLGMTYFYLGQQERAEAVLAEGAKRELRDPDFLYVRSNVRRVHDLPGSIEDYERYVTLTAGGRELPAKRERVLRTLQALRTGERVWSEAVLEELTAARGERPSDMRAVGDLPGFESPSHRAPRPKEEESLEIFWPLVGLGVLIVLLGVVMAIVRRARKRRQP